MKEINDLLTPAVTVETISKTVEADETVYNMLKASKGEETAALIAKLQGLSSKAAVRLRPFRFCKAEKQPSL